MSDAGGHRLTVELIEPVPPEVEVGIQMTFRVMASCSSGCDLDGALVCVSLAGDLAAEGRLAARARELDPAELQDDAGQAEQMPGDNSREGHGPISESGPMVVTVPTTVGQYVWRITVSPGDDQPTHDEGAMDLPFLARPHTTSMAVWDVPSPVVVGTAFRAILGAKCSASCDMQGGIVRVRDESGEPIGEGTLGSKPWPGTTALYVAEVELTAPSARGLNSWSGTLDVRGLEVPHEEATAAFSFQAVGPPDHSVRVEVIEASTQEPLHGAEIRLGVFRATTDQAGVGVVGLPTGDYQLTVWKTGYEAKREPVSVSEDLALRVEVEVAADPQSDDDRVWM